jgi:hypothetical protein
MVHQDIFATDRNSMFQEYLATANIQAPVGDPRHVFLDHGRTLEDRPDLFSDPHHLNHRGRAVFSRGLRYELIRRGLLPDREGRNAFPVPADDDEDAR